MPNTDDHTGWIVTPDDDRFHDSGRHPWQMETFWVSFFVPERKMSGWFYNQFLPNQGDTGTYNGGAFVWNDEDDSPYHELIEGAPLPAERDLRDIVTPGGNHLQTIEPLHKYRVTRHDPGRFEAEMIFEAVMEPNPHPEGVAPFWKGHHFDQAMHVTGELVLNGEKLEIDSLAVRDRSWSPRPPKDAPKPPPKPRAPDAPPRLKIPPFELGYVLGTASPQDAFLAYSMMYEGTERDEVVTGYLIRDGVWAHLVSGERRCVVDPDREWIWQIELEAEDTLGRSLAAEGRMVSHQGKCGPTAGGPGNALFYWKWNGAEGWGENQGGSTDWYPRRRPTP
ncbi:MAG: hypothetical protein P8Q97_07795 [Myxococcota bacterium]|nr:hypothetical protein [Myxococcota bacterium]